MKKLIKTIVVLLFVNFCYAETVRPQLELTATITGGGMVCQNGTSPIITFTGSGGTAPYTFTYTINGGANNSVSSPGASAIQTISAPTDVVGSYDYVLVSVSDSSGTVFLTDASVNVLVSSFPTVEFVFNDNLCSGDAVLFTSMVSGGSTANTYSWDFGDGSALSNDENPIHIFTALGCGTQTFTVKLTVSNNGCSIEKAHMVTVKQKPNVEFNDANNPFNPFNNCANAATNSIFTITVQNSLSSSCVSSYSIDWGDNSAVENNVTFPKSHTYTQIGAYAMVITAFGLNGCNTVQTYIVKNVTNPFGGLNSPGSTQNLCAPTSDLQFSISNWGANSLDTTYSVDYGDGTILLLTQSQLNSSVYYNTTNPLNSANYPVPHNYVTSSCPASSFQVKLNVTNACGTTPFTLGNISILSKPEAAFTVAESSCVGSSVLITNTTIPGFGLNCTTNATYKWDFGDGSAPVTTTSSSAQNISHTYTTAGTFVIALTVTGYCGSSTITKTICIQPVVTPSFALTANQGCAPFESTATNSTIITAPCSDTTFSWTVSYAAAYCGLVSGFTFTNGTTANSQNPTFNFTEAGTYTLTLNATNSCGTTTTSKVVSVKKPPTISINSVADVCGSASISPTANIPVCATASGTVTYAWSFPGGTPATAATANPGSISYSTSGPHTISLVVTNECGPSNTATQNFTVNPIPSITNTNLTQEICSGASTSAIALTANEVGTTFSWTATATAGITGFIPSGTTTTIPAQTISTSNPSAGTVTYTIIPKLGNCTGTAVQYTIIINPAPTITTQPQPSTVCLNGTATPLTVVVSTTTGTASYQWYSNTTNSTTGGILIVGATASTFSPPTEVVGDTYYYCVITLSSGGCSSLTSNTALVKVLELPTITLEPTANQDLCVGVTTTNPLKVTASGGTGTISYQWYSNTANSTTGGTAISGATSATYTPPVFNSAGTYYYYATLIFSGNNCGSLTTQVATITVFNDPTITSQPLTTQNLCQGAAPTALEVAAAGGSGTFVYQWYSNSTNTTTGGNLIVGATNASFVPVTTIVGTVYYYCIVSQTTAGCSVTSTTSAVVINQSPSVSIASTVATACLGGNPPPFVVSISNGIGTPSYQWYSNTVNSNTSGTLLAGETNQNFTPSASSIGTTYFYCSVTFPAITGSCSNVLTNTSELTVAAGATIDENPLSTQSICVGGTTSTPLSVSYNDGTGTPSYQWFSNTINSNSGGTSISGATTAQFTPSPFLASGTFYFYVEISFSSSGCGAISSEPAEIAVVNDPIINLQPLTTQALCQNATPSELAVTASGGIGTTYTYQWYSSTTNSNTNGVAILGATNSTFLPTTSAVGTTYYYCVVNQVIGSGCNATSSTAEVIVNPAPTIVNQPLNSSYCINQIANPLTVTYSNGIGTANYQWYSNTNNANSGGAAIAGETGASFTPPTSAVSSTYYYCVITFPSLVGGCEVIASNTAQITVNPFPNIASENTTICSNNSFSITPIDGNGNTVPPGTTYTWSQPTVTPAGALSGFSAQSIPQSEISQNLVNLTSSPATITYTVTPTAGICIGTTFTVTVTVNPAINPNIVVNNNTCFGVNNASISTNITGGITPYSILWSGPNGFTSTATAISNIEPGVYTITIEDAGNCPFTNSYTITQPDDILLTTISENNSSCYQINDGSIAISVTGGTGAYSFSWTKDATPFANTQNISNLSPGIYEVTVTDQNNCGPKTNTFTITEPPLLVVSLLNQTNINCFGAATGAINVTVSGGTIASDYNFSWTGPNGFTSASQNLASLIAGTYNLTVTDDNNCQKTLQVTLTQSSAIVVSYTTTPITCFGGNNGSISASISGGNAPYTFEWNNFSTSLNQNNLSAGNYTITVTDNLGCIKIETIIIPEAPIFTVNPIVKNISCFGANDGSINLNLVGGMAPIALSWNDGSSAGVTRNNLPAGTYTVTISDGTPCFIVRTFTIIEPQPLVASANLTNPTNCTNANTGAIDLTVSGGTPPFTISWSNGSSSEDLNNLVAGTYLVQIQDKNGCTTSGQYQLFRPDPITITVTTQTDVDCVNKKVNQIFTALASGGIPPFQFQWSSGTISGTNNEIMTTDTNGIVELLVTDSAGCNQSYTVNVNNLAIGNASFNTSSFAYTNFGLYSINDPIQFNSTITGDYESIYWDFGDGTFSTELNPIHTYLIPNNYEVVLTVTYSFGCVYKTTINLSVEKGYVLVLPTAFTPNKDGINENYRPVTKGLKNIMLYIYDSWGSVIYSEKGDIIKGWDGKIKGFNAENGNYYSKVSAETFYGTTIYDNKTIVIIK